MFLDDLADIFEKHLMSHTNIIVTGDFNLHMDKMDDPDVNLFKDTIQACDLDCQVDFPIHWSGHTLDLALTETTGNIKTSMCKPGVFLSDQCSVKSIFNIKKATLERKELSYKKIDAIDVEDFCNELHQNQLKALPLEDKIQQFNSELRVLDKFTP